MDKQILLAKLNCNLPVTTGLLMEFEREAGFQLPGDYVRFLQETNGGEGFVGPNAYVILWRVEELLQMNKAYEVAEYAPGLFLFGSDGGGEAFAFDRRFDSESIVSVPFVGMDLALVRPQAANFQEFMERLYKS